MDKLLADGATVERRSCIFTFYKRHFQGTRYKPVSNSSTNVPHTFPLLIVCFLLVTLHVLINDPQIHVTR
jgi:hypothetical protein